MDIRKSFLTIGYKEILKSIHINIEKEVKSSAKQCDNQEVFQLIEKSTFIGFSDVTAIKILFKIGIRIHTVCESPSRCPQFWFYGRGTSK